MKISTTGAACVLAAVLSAGAFFAQDTQTAVRIVTHGPGYTLIRNGQPFFIKGAGGAVAYMPEAIAAGANSIREWKPDEAALARSRAQGLTVLLGLTLGIPRHGFNYGDPAAVHQQLQQTVATVHRLKNEPAVLMWALGNELELGASPAQRIAVWQAVDNLARAVKKEDPNHPVIAVLAGAGQDKLRELDKYCPSLDAVGINTYGGIMNLPETVAQQDFRRPYIVTEFGPRGHWEVAKTDWGMPIEDTSTEKADFIRKGYDHAIAGRPQCLGSYIFVWGQKQEKTHTWYGLFLPDGAHLGGVDAMQYLWTGKWPAHRAPEIEGTIAIKQEGAEGETGDNTFPAGSRLLCSVTVGNGHDGPVRIQWDLRKDVANNPSSGGDFEPPTPPIPGSIEREDGGTAVVRLPDRPGDYRIFVYAYNQYNGAATANVPIRAK